MATYLNNLRLKEIATGDESGTWGTSTNTNLELVTDGFSYGTKDMAADANETFTMPDATADATRGLYLKITSAVSLTATREVTLGPNTVSKVWIIENATTGSQIITIKQGSGATVDVANGSKVMIVTDGAGAGAAVINANPTEAGAGTVTSVGGTGTVNGITLTGTVTSSGDLTLGGTLANVDLTTQVTGTLPIANGGTGSTSTTYVDLTANVTGTLPIANGGTGSTSTTYVDLTANVTGTLPIANGGTGSTSTTYVDLTANVTGTLPVANGGTGVTTSTGTGAVVLGTAPTITGMTLAGAVTGADQTVSAINLKDYGEVTNAIGSTGGGTQDIDLTLGNYVTATVDTSANTFTFSNPTASDEGCGFTLVLTNGGSQTVTWPASVDWPDATAPTLTAAGVDKLVFETSDGGTTWLGNLAGLAYA
jgi:predicted aconitase with swiveling domain